jgi:hypothetical protein
MPGSRKKPSYTKEDFDEAMEAVKGGLSVRKASLMYGVPRATMQDRISELHSSRQGRPPVLTPEEEEMIVERLKIMADWGFPFNTENLCHFVKQYLDKKGEKTRFKENLPTRKFVVTFLNRHKELTLRKANPIKRSRAMVSRENVAEFFENFKKTAEGVPPENLFNYDETNLRDDPGVKKCVFKKGTKYCETVQNSSKQAELIIQCMGTGTNGSFFYSKNL